MMRTADVRTDSDTRRWEARLNREWPQRVQVADWICTQISGKSASSPRVVELACGAGFLAEILATRLPGMRYRGFDLSSHLLDFARRRLGCSEKRADGAGDIQFIRMDLVRDDWSTLLHDMGWAGKLDAVVSIQALHDLGGLGQQTTVLATARALLRSGGVVAYGDLLLDARNPHTSRYTAAQHEEMLRAAGFTTDKDSQPARSATELQESSPAGAGFGNFGCFLGIK